MGEVFMGPGFRTCSHAGCKWPAIVTLSFDYSAGRVWLEDLRTAPEVSAYDLCSVHAGRFRPPKGWMVDDLRRVPEPTFDVPTSSESKEPAPAPVSNRVGSEVNGAVSKPTGVATEPAITANGSGRAAFTEARASASDSSPESDAAGGEPAEAMEPRPMGITGLQYPVAEESATSLLRRMEIREEDDEIAELKRLVARDI